MVRLAVIAALAWLNARPSELERARRRYLAERAAAEGAWSALSGAADRDLTPGAREAAERVRAQIVHAQELFERGITEGNPAHVHAAIDALRLKGADAELAEGFDHGA